MPEHKSTSLSEIFKRLHLEKPYSISVLASSRLFQSGSRRFGSKESIAPLSIAVSMANLVASRTACMGRGKRAKVKDSGIPNQICTHFLPGQHHVSTRIANKAELPFTAGKSMHKASVVGTPASATSRLHKFQPLLWFQKAACRTYLLRLFQ